MDIVEPETVTIETQAVSVAEENALATVEQSSPPATLPESQGAAILAIIAQAAADSRVDPAKMRELLELRREVIRDEAAIEARRAYGRVCRNMPRIKKNGAIDFGKNTKPIPYARWEDIAEAIRPVYEVENFTLSFDTRERQGGGLIVSALLTHDNGHVITSEFPVPLDTSGGKQNIQGMGSAGSYGQRYATKNLFNLVFEGEDDDGKLGAVTFITADQVEQISALVNDTASDPAEFLKWVFGDEAPHSYAEIPAARFTGTLNALMSKKRRMEKEASK